MAAPPSCKAHFLAGPHNTSQLGRQPHPTQQRQQRQPTRFNISQMSFFSGSTLFVGGSATVPEGAATVAVPESFTCPITHDVMQDPVIDRRGNCYERAAIESWVREHGSSPITREPMSLADLTPNRGLADLIEAFVVQQQQSPAAVSAVGASVPAAAMVACGRRALPALPDAPMTLQVDAEWEPKEPRIHGRRSKQQPPMRPKITTR